MFALARQLPEADASTRPASGKNRFMGVEVTGKTLGLIGAGNIGSIVASRALGLKMKVVAFDPFLTPSARWKWASKRPTWKPCWPRRTSSPCTRR
jgi:D-3-phosphoglycerate dehydrogenase